MDKANKVKVFNDTLYTFRVRDNDHFLGTIYPVNQRGSSFTYEFFEDTILYWNLFLFDAAAAVGSSKAALFIPAIDNKLASEIRVYETPSKEIRHWISKPRGSSDELPRPVYPASKDLAAFEAVKKDVRTRMKTVERHRVNLEQVLKQVKICHAQCNQLVQTYSKGIQNMIENYSLVSENPSHMWSLYESKQLRLLSSSLNSLLRSLIVAENLLQACGEKELKRIALVVSMPPAQAGTFSNFDVVIRELSWALDVIQYASSLETLEFSWSDERCRYVLKRHGMHVSVAGVESLADDTIVCDRRNLLSQLESEATPTPQIDVSSNLKLNFPEGFAVVVKKRLQDFSTSSELTPGLVPDCFWINPKDLHLGRRISRGSFKKIYRGEWFGQPVAIAKIKGCTRDTIEKEAGFMVNVQHPNIVDFFGCAFVEDSTAEDGNPNLTGFLVMELMPEDLWSLINREAKSHSGAPFSFSVSVDILLQIVEAMMHLHNHHVIYRDLKAKNCLVSPRPKSSPRDPDVYMLKLIDFGTSKILDSKNDKTGTFNVGSRRWMAPEVWGIIPSKPAVKSCFPFRFLSRKQPVAKEQEGPENSYSRSADVYSFAMTCYEITTGLLPFHDVEDLDFVNPIFRERRPSFSHPAAIACPQRLQKLMTDCWAQEPRDRPQFEAIRRELWSIKHDIEVQR